MAKNKSLYDRLNNRQGNQSRTTTFQEVVHVRKPLDVNKDILEDNPDMDSILQDTRKILSVDEGDRSGTRFSVPPYERQIKDKRFRTTQVHNTKIDNQ